MKKHNFEIDSYNFKEIVCDYIGFKDLEKIHKYYNPEPLKEGTDQATYYHKIFYSKMDSDGKFINLYYNFIKKYISELFLEEILFQKYPTFRIHYPNNVAVFEFHKDKEYSHNPKEINFFLPITSAFETNTFWIESEEDKGDYYPVEAEYGEVVEFNGANLRHGNKINKTDFTRISFDFRILKKSDYVFDESKISKTKNIKFQIGGYYEELKNI
jgi:hypothetical protein